MIKSCKFYKNPEGLIAGIKMTLQDDKVWYVPRNPDKSSIWKTLGLWVTFDLEKTSFIMEAILWLAVKIVHLLKNSGCSRHTLLLNLFNRPVTKLNAKFLVGGRLKTRGFFVLLEFWFSK